MRNIQLKLASAIAILVAVGSVGFGQTTYTVNKLGTGMYSEIEPAMLIATNGDTVEVTDNATYAEEVDFDGEDIVLKCDPMNRATIEPPPGGTTSFLIDMSGGLTRQGTLLGFKVQFATNGAITCSGSSPTIAENRIESNILPAGNFNSAGITGVDSSPAILDNIFESNLVFENGGAIYLEGQSTVAGTPATQILDNEFSFNEANDAALTPFDRKGGAIYAVADASGPQMQRIEILRNEFLQNVARGYGGAIALESRPALIIENHFLQNIMLFQTDDVYPCGSPISYGGGAVALLDCDYDVCILTSNTYESNWSDYDGGAIYVWNSVARLTQEYVERSLANCQGGAVFCGEGSLTVIAESLFFESRADEGGGIAYVDTDLSLLQNSEITRCGAFVAGAGILSLESDPTIVDVLLQSNGEDLAAGTFTKAPVNGGGIAIRGGSAELERCEIIQNASAGDGGGIYAVDVANDLTVLNCILGANIAVDDFENLTPSNGAAMYVEYLVSGAVTPFASNTVARNRAESTGFSGIYVATSNTMDVINGIVWNNKNGYSIGSGTATGPNQTMINSILGASGFFVDFSDIKNTGTFTPGSNNISAIPKFDDIPNADFRIKPLSPCVDMGTNSAPLISGGDIDNATRIHNGTIDMGADEALSFEQKK